MSKECDPRLPCDTDENEEKVEEKYDPRSYCFTVASKTGEVCLPKSCHIVKKRLEENDKEAEEAKEISKRIPIKQPVKTCVPWNGKQSWKPSSTRHFGQVSGTEDKDDEEQFFRMFGSQLGLVLDEGTVSETDTLKGRPQGANRITREGRLVRSDSYEEFTDENGNLVRRKRQPGVSGQPDRDGRSTPFGIVRDQETAELLENLSKFFDAEGMAAIVALGGTEICPCCRCTSCQCRLRGVTSEMLLAQRKKALLENKLKSWGKQGYVWSFDYYYEPDFEYFEKEKGERQKLENMKEMEKEVMSLKMEVGRLGEEESVDEFFDKTRTEGVTVIEEEKDYGEVQATPSNEEKEL